MELKQEDSVPIKNSKKKTFFIILGVAILVVGLVVSWLIYDNHKKEEAKKEYAKLLNSYAVNLSTFSIAVITAGTQAEDITNQYSSVWHDAIWESPVTIDGERYYDFNAALAAQFTLFQTNGDLDSLDENMDIANGLIKELKNPPNEFEREYDVALDAYDALNDFVSLAKNPNGSLQTFVQESSAKDNDLAAAIQKLNNVLE
jgi:hypothetical protein